MTVFAVFSAAFTPMAPFLNFNSSMDSASGNGGDPRMSFPEPLHKSAPVEGSRLGNSLSIGFDHLIFSYSGTLPVPHALDILADINGSIQSVKTGAFGPRRVFYNKFSSTDTHDGRVRLNEKLVRGTGVLGAFLFGHHRLNCSADELGRRGSAVWRFHF